MRLDILCEKDSELARARANVYTYLGTTFSAPPSALGIPMVLCEDIEAAFGSGVADAFELHASSIQDSSEWAAQTKSEFMSLFKVPGPRYVPPYESVYVDAREIEGKKVSGLLMGQSAIDVQKWYRLAALNISEEYRDLPDHITLEFAYMAHLCKKECEFSEEEARDRLLRAQEMQRDFLAAHPARWLAPFCDRIIKNTDNPYFKAVARLSQQFTSDDLAQLENRLGPSSGHLAPNYAPCASSDGCPDETVT